jgi:hypothetical protein
MGVWLLGLVCDIDRIKEDMRAGFATAVDEVKSEALDALVIGGFVYRVTLGPVNDRFFTAEGKDFIDVSSVMEKFQESSASASDETYGCMRFL